MDRNTDEQTQAMMLDFEMQKRHLEELSNARSQLASRLQEVENAMSALEALEGKKDADIMVPLGAGVFIKGKIEDTSSAIVSVGAGIAIGKELPEALKFIGAERQRLADAAAHMDKEILDIEKKASAIVSQIQQSESAGKK